MRKANTQLKPFVLPTIKERFNSERFLVMLGDAMFYCYPADRRRLFKELIIVLKNFKTTERKGR
jgi:hypothetical protein